MYQYHSTTYSVHNTIPCLRVARFLLLQVEDHRVTIRKTNWSASDRTFKVNEEVQKCNYELVNHRRSGTCLQRTKGGKRTHRTKVLPPVLIVRIPLTISHLCYIFQSRTAGNHGW